MKVKLEPQRTTPTKAVLTCTPPLTDNILNSLRKVLRDMRYNPDHFTREGDALVISSHEVNMEAGLLEELLSDTEKEIAEADRKKEREQQEMLRRWEVKLGLKDD